MSPAHHRRPHHGGMNDDANAEPRPRELATRSTNPVLVEVTRSGWVESVHRGTVVLINADHTVRTFGDASVPTYPRSSLKPLQITALGRLGLRLPTTQLALATASHSGTAEQVSVVNDMLTSAGLTSADLACPPALPDDPQSAQDLLRTGGGPDSIFHNCSGKHAAMLTTCVLNGWPTAGYLQPRHPLQVQIRTTVEELCGEAPSGTGVDGCGAPVFVLSLPGLARAYRHIGTAPGDLPEGLVAGAIRARPELVAGPGRSTTALMAAMPGLLAKEGAEGIWGAALPDGRTVTVKVDDGAMRALPPVLAAVVRWWGAHGDAVDTWERDAVLGGGEPVGAVRPSPEFIIWLADGEPAPTI